MRKYYVFLIIMVCILVITQSATDIKNFLQAHLGYSATDKNNWFLDIFVFYMASLFSFAGIYYRIYRKQPETFVFGSDIAASQRTKIKAPVLESRGEYDQLNQLLDDFFKEVGESEEPVTCENLEPYFYEGRLKMWKSPATSKLITRNRIYRLDVILSAMGIIQYVFYIIEDRQDGSLIYKRDIHYIFSPFVPFEIPQTRSRWKVMSESMKKYANRSLNLHDKHSTEIEKGVIPIWSYWDFLYFSTITQGTVGYGDILPNCTKVRMIVMVQTVITVLLLVVIINVSFSK